MPCDGVPRCYEPLTDEHLHHLVTLAVPIFETLFDNRPDGSGRYRGRLLMLALCQGAALHRVNGQHGVKDLDVWGFFHTHPDGEFPPRWHQSCDFGPSSLGFSPHDPGYTGRRVDVLGRSIGVRDEEDALAAVRRYLGSHATETADLLAQRPVIALHPAPLFGVEVWPVGL
ncbi:hypothetical protein MKK55_26815 [Methylobacterium sp. J-059]|uniref:hypothetical protein n=1 Tax=Methylobacterium sp. J-059 TaxID=2836643 RepID=UPI001FBA5C22|nr:hypothetical protein [Methylobacterium sp. J-059]MCJ2042532.1 hypothetical protein [Methylobacterium sp. J-059]